MVKIKSESKINVGVVILNYIEAYVTVECLKSFNNQDTNGVNVQFVVIDNCSPNNSYEMLYEKYKNIENISVVKTPYNLGFANGNNFGYHELLKKMKPDFVIFSNSDILLPKNNIYQWIIQNYEMYKFGVLGPSIYSVNANFYQSPIRNLSKDKREISRSIREMQISLLKIKLKTLFNIKNSNSSLEQWENSQYEELHDNLTLHGAFQVMSKRYFDEYSEAYDKGTFLYYEEDILKLRCDKASLPMIYSPDYTVNHLQSFSTNSNEKNVNKKNLKRVQNMLKSLKRYQAILEE
ncbi:glycosyltransferase family 2 protein [Streptococcus infantarius]|uniref:glycosyltransferase family 2 protein n=2 Tax=Streptococcus infantarius TaxID=102684 RepID=UPI0022E3C242|nr:glycosyltransferase [Streptococcus infantarius]